MNLLERVSHLHSDETLDKIEANIAHFNKLRLIHVLWTGGEASLSMMNNQY